MRRPALIIVVTAFVVLLPMAAQAIADFDPVITSPRPAEYYPFVNDSYVVFTRYTNAKGDVALAKPLDGTAAVTLNAEGKYGISGGIDPGTNSVIYQQYSQRGSDIFLYDLDTGRRSKVASVSTKLWEFDPRISSSFIMYSNDRWRGGDWYSSIFVYDRDGGTTRKLGTWKEPRILVNGSVGDRYATYTFCTRRNCFGSVYDWETDTTQRIPSVDNKPQYAPVVDEVNSTVYFSRARNMTCGPDVAIWRRPLPLTTEEGATQVAVLPRGIDTGWTHSLSSNVETGNMDLYIERWDCQNRTGDIYVARGVDAEGTS